MAELTNCSKGTRRHTCQLLAPLSNVIKRNFNEAGFLAYDITIKPLTSIGLGSLPPEDCVFDIQSCFMATNIAG